ncbi:hypothetical protein BZ214_23555 [Salmonella enterica subsp. enterica serovar Newport]|nr:hypothetical protein [Salmonella enterica]EDF4265282.1 hypothetical protein [Salmonella enterica subsp. enterica serovar Newport]ECH2720094.1 hypothetical protein [Salmonella enterica]ECK3727580.1 hypothetical protein [Salmonella enterica]ECZ4422859.1 hypothetical protein [Salmonella enterica]
MNALKMIVGIVTTEDLFWMGWRELSIKENPKFGDFPEFVTTDSFKRERRTLEGESIYQVFHLKENDYHKIFSLFSMKEDSDLNELYGKLKRDGKKPDYFIALKLNGDKL